MTGFILYIILVHCLGWTEVDEREEEFALKKGSTCSMLDNSE